METSTKQNNLDHQLCLLEKLDLLKQKTLSLSERKSEHYQKKNQLSPLERLHALLDHPELFLPIGEFAGAHLDHPAKLGGGQWAGIGSVAGKWVMIQVYNSAIKGGMMTPIGVQRTLRLQAIALAQKLPMIMLVESAGADLTQQADLFIEAGKTFANQARLSAQGILSIAVVHGTATAGGAYVAGLADYTIMVKEHAHVFLAGPPLVKAATGENASAEELGGTHMHSTISGLCDLTANSDQEAISLAREVIHQAPITNTTLPQKPNPIDDHILSLIPQDYREPTNPTSLIEHLIDSTWLAFKPEFGPSTITGFAYISGHPVGIISNQGPIDSSGAEKASQFIQLCDQQNRTLIFLQNTTGFMVGKRQEQSGIVRYGSRLIKAVTNASVAKITLHIGASFGAGNYAMCSRSLNPDFIFAWPNNKLSVMGGQQAAKVMDTISSKKDLLSYQQKRQDLINQYEQESSAVYCSGRLWDDGIIDPRQTRWVFAVCLDIIHQASKIDLKPSQYGTNR